MGGAGRYGSGRVPCKITPGSTTGFVEIMRKYASPEGVIAVKRHNDRMKVDKGPHTRFVVLIQLGKGHDWLLVDDSLENGGVFLRNSVRLLLSDTNVHRRLLNSLKRGAYRRERNEKMRQTRIPRHGRLTSGTGSNQSRALIACLNASLDDTRWMCSQLMA